MKPALFVIDLQKAYYRDGAKSSMQSACEKINAIIPCFRAKGLPVVWIQHIDESDGAIPGTEGFEFIDALEPGTEDYHIVKKYGNSFNKTKCFDIISANAIDTIVITGYCAEYCVLSTYRGAEDLDLKPLILRHAISSENQDHLRMVESICNQIDLERLKEMLGGM